MPAAKHGHAGRSNACTDKFAGRSRQTRRSIVAVMRRAQEFLGAKAPAILAVMTDTRQVRTCERWVQKNNPTTPTSDNFIAMLQSEQGFQFLQAAMETATTQPAWWKRTLKQYRLSELRVSLRAQEKELRDLEENS